MYFWVLVLNLTCKDQVWNSYVCNPKTKCEALMSLYPKPNVILWCVNPLYSIKTPFWPKQSAIVKFKEFFDNSRQNNDATVKLNEPSLIKDRSPIRWISVISRSFWFMAISQNPDSFIPFKRLFICLNAKFQPKYIHKVVRSVVFLGWIPG